MLTFINAVCSWNPQCFWIGKQHLRLLSAVLLVDWLVASEETPRLVSLLVYKLQIRTHGCL
jgi:hypothetical protein